MAYEGSCHCGAVAFRVDAEAPTEALTCNCSHCRRKGFILSFVPADAVSIIRGDEAVTEYHFNKRTIAHPFCSTCGCQPFGRLTRAGPDGVRMMAVNLRLVPSIDLDSLTVRMADGASV